MRACGAGATITPDAIAGMTIGASRAKLERLWGSPDRVRAGAEGTEVATWQAAYDGSRPASYASVVLNSDRVTAMSVELTGTRLHTLRGDRLGTPAATIRRHWPGARRYRSCCAADVFYLTVRAAREGHVLVFALRRGAGLRSVHLVADRMFEDCFVHECD